MRRFLWLWLILLLASNGLRLLSDDALPLQSDQIAVTLDERDADVLTGDTIEVAVRRYGDPSKPAILLLHGTPVASPALRSLAELLEGDFYVISPDLPGFGRSTLKLADYSSITHGHYVADLLNAMGIGSTHIIGYSQGGAPAIVLASDHAERVESLTLLAAIGVQELELFGSYPVNHAVYAGQLALVNACEWLLPHFGFLDGAILGLGYAKNLVDTDQRVLREKLTRIEVPTLIVHGERDGLVPFAAAEEHKRLVPQSTLVAVDAGHEIGYGTPELVTPSIRAFIDRVNAGEEDTRASADPSRLEAAKLPYVTGDREPLSGFPLVVLVLAIVVAAYVSEDLTCIASGFLVAQGILSLPIAILACLIGLFTSDVALFFIGRWFGAPAVKRLVSDSAINRATDWLNRRGPLVIIISRFTPGTRLPTYLVAGALRMPVPVFISYFALATAIWTPILVGVAATYGAIVERWFEEYAASAIWLFLGGALLLVFAARILPPLFTRRGRRLALGQWRRMTRFEYWPRWAYYAPVVLFNVGMALRYRSLTLFTIANPAIPLSGLTGESKSQILSALAPSGAVAAFTTIDSDRPDARLDQIREFVAAHGGYPIVMKPDAGERGREVEVIHSDAQASAYLKNANGTIIAQQMVSGEEYGVMYCRLPNAATGSVTSIAHKGHTIVTGDGASTLEQLILNDDRAVNMAPVFLNTHSRDLQGVPGNGEPVRLNAIGTHSRGSIFTDAGHLNSEQLVQTLDQITGHFDGFFLGRFDLFVPNPESLTKGRSLSIVELNGLTSEPAHIYHPGASLLDGLKATCAHWASAWQIGAQLAKSGHRPPGAIRVIKELRALTQPAATK
ncbi:MAG: alpha/beta fold hydrolase [Pseudomonadota bacterium]